MALKVKIPVIILLLSGVGLLPGCKQKYAVEIKAIDSLIARNNKALSYMQIDLVTIHEREQEMAGQIAVLEAAGPDSSVAEFTMNLERFKGIHKVYKRFITNYDQIINRTRFNEKQLISLKNSLRQEKISGQEYKIALRRETQNVNDNLFNAETFGRRIFQMEPDYQRLSAYFDPLVDSVLKAHPELKAPAPPTK